MKRLNLSLLRITVAFGLVLASARMSAVYAQGCCGGGSSGGSSASAPAHGHDSSGNDTGASTTTYIDEMARQRQAEAIRQGAAGTIPNMGGAAPGVYVNPGPMYPPPPPGQRRTQIENLINLINTRPPNQDGQGGFPPDPGIIDGDDYNGPPASVTTLPGGTRVVTKNNPNSGETTIISIDPNGNTTRTVTGPGQGSTPISTTASTSTAGSSSGSGAQSSTSTPTTTVTTLPPPTDPDGPALTPPSTTADTTTSGANPPMVTTSVPSSGPAASTSPVPSGTPPPPLTNVTSLPPPPPPSSAPSGGSSIPIMRESWGGETDAERKRETQEIRDWIGSTQEGQNFINNARGTMPDVPGRGPNRGSLVGARTLVAENKLDALAGIVQQRRSTDRKRRNARRALDEERRAGRPNSARANRASGDLGRLTSDSNFQGQEIQRITGGTRNRAREVADAKRKGDAYEGSVIVSIAGNYVAGGFGKAAPLVSAAFAAGQGYVEGRNPLHSASTSLIGGHYVGGPVAKFISGNNPLVNAAFSAGGQAILDLGEDTVNAMHRERDRNTRNSRR